MAFASSLNDFSAKPVQCMIAGLQAFWEPVRWLQPAPAGNAQLSPRHLVTFLQPAVREWHALERVSDSADGW